MARYQLKKSQLIPAFKYYQEYLDSKYTYTPLSPASTTSIQADIDGLFGLIKCRETNLIWQLRPIVTPDYARQTLNLSFDIPKNLVELIDEPELA